MLQNIIATNNPIRKVQAIATKMSRQPELVIPGTTAIGLSINYYSKLVSVSIMPSNTFTAGPSIIM